MNRRTAAQIQRVADTASQGHKKVILAALQRWAEKTTIAQSFPHIKDLCTGEAIYHLISSTDGYSCRNDRTIVCDIARAILRGRSTEQCRRLLQSKINYYFRLLPETSYGSHLTNSEQEIARLESRLARLREDDDITDSTQCFELERKIYDLKRKLDDDEWPDEIDG